MSNKYSSNLIPKMTSNTTPEGTVFASSFYSGTRDPWRAFNHIVDSYTREWTSNNNFPQWIGYQFTTPKKIEAYALTNITDDGWGVMPKKWIFQGSNDGVNWIDLGTIDNEVEWINSERRFYTFVNNDEFDRYRLFIQDNNREISKAWTILGEFEMMELLTQSKHLIKSQNKIHILSNNVWTDITLNIADINNITQEEFETYGMSSLEGLPMDILNQEDEFEVLTWTDDLESIPKLELTVPKYKPIDLLDSPEIVTLGNGEEIPKLHIKGFRDLRPLCESDSPKLLINTEQKNSPIIITKAISKKQLVISKGDIELRMLNRVQSFAITSEENNNGKIRVIASVDSGLTWKTFDSILGEFKDIDIANLDEVEREGMTIAEFNSVGLNWNGLIRESKIKFGYYLEMDEVDDTANVDKLEVSMEVLGSWEGTLHETDYNYEYDNEKVYIELYRDGSYKINYYE